MAFCGVTLKPCSPVSATLACTRDRLWPGRQAGRGWQRLQDVAVLHAAVRAGPSGRDDLTCSPQRGKPHPDVGAVTRMAW